MVSYDDILQALAIIIENLFHSRDDSKEVDIAYKEALSLRNRIRASIMREKEKHESQL